MPIPISSSQNNIPAVQEALVQDVDGALVLKKNAPVPHLTRDEALVKVYAVGLNPTDYKMPSYFTSPGAVGGCDFAGSVVALGKTDTVSRLKVGDRVLGAVHGSNPLDHSTGSFANYVRVPVDLLAKVPATVGWEEAAALGGVGHGTCALAIWECLKLEGTPLNPVKEPIPVLVYGGSTATGTMAIQMLKLSGYSPIAVCSMRNFSLAESVGATHCFDYSSPTCGSEIRAMTGNVLKYCIDCISDEHSAALCYQAIGRAGGRYVCLEKIPDEVTNKRKAIHSEFLMGYDIYGKKIGLSRGYERPPNAQRQAAGVKWFLSLERLLEEGRIKPHPVEVSGSRLDDIPGGLARLKRGEVSGKKLVVTI